MKRIHRISCFALLLLSWCWSAPAFAGQATLTWDPPTTNADGTALTDLAGYKVYYGTASRNYASSLDVGKVTTRTIANLADGTTYYFAVTAYDTARNESVRSNEVSKAMPALAQYTLTVAKSGSGAGTVTGTGINCGADCSELLIAGATVTFTAQASANSSFVGWSGGGCSGTGTCSITVNGPTTVTASFLNTTPITTLPPITLPPITPPAQQYTLTVVKSGSGAGTVTGTGINCGTDCSELLNGGTRVTLSAQPSSNSTFSGWSGGGCTGTGICVVTVNAAMTVTASFLTTAPPTLPTAPSIAGDFNRDGQADILWRNKATGQNSVWFMDGITVQRGEYIDTVSDKNWEIAATGDFNGDGHTDILWRNKSAGWNAIWLMNGVRLQRGEYIDTVSDKNWEIAATGDFDGDGQTDILWRNYATGYNAIWFMNGVRLQRGEYIDTVRDVNWEMAATGDFDGDGRTDILWRNYSTGSNRVWLMNGSSLKSRVYIDRLYDTSWEISAAGDFNGDGQTDILWRNYTTGENAVWFMNGLRVLRRDTIASVQDTNWKIVGPR